MLTTYLPTKMIVSVIFAALFVFAGCGGDATTLLRDDAGLAASGAADSARAPDDLAGDDLIGVDLRQPSGGDLAHVGWSGHSNVQLTASGCSPSLTGDIIVLASSHQVTITQRYMPLLGSLTIQLKSGSSVIAVSSAERIATGDLVNLIVDTTYTNISSKMPDPVGGQITVNAYDDTTGVVDLVFTGLKLENVSTHAICTLTGTVQSDGKDF